MTIDFIQPVVLVVKAPNQQIADQTVECAWDWTIRKLKDHLAAVYPSQPRQEQQKLIYYGRLLLDHLTLKDVLKQYEGQSTHTVHLVCSGSHGAAPKTETTPKSESPSVSSQNGLRRRNTTTPENDSTANQTTQQTSQPAPQQAPNAAYQAYYQQMMAQYAQNPLMTSQMGQMTSQSPQNMMVYQQMYAQQMAQYMQYWQTMYQSQYQQITPNLPAAPQLAPPLAPGAPLGGPQMVPPQQQQQVAPAARRENNNVVLNAGAGGAALFDDDEQEQDWLDWFYTGCRFAVLIMIIYFYSTIPRAVVGLMFFFFLYMYQQGWFNPPPVRRPDVAIPAPAPPAPAQPAPPAPAQQERPENDNEQAPENSSSDDNSDDNTGPEAVVSPPPVSRLYVTWTFFKTFFTSLLPRPPAVV